MFGKRNGIESNGSDWMVLIRCHFFSIVSNFIYSWASLYQSSPLYFYRRCFFFVGLWILPSLLTLFSLVRVQWSFSCAFLPSSLLSFLFLSNSLSNVKDGFRITFDTKINKFNNYSLLNRT